VIGLIAIVFILGYSAIALEHPLKVNKSATALLTGGLVWTIYALGAGPEGHVVAELAEHLSEIAAILFFLLGAMTIVELIDAHDGFQIIVDAIRTRNKRSLLYIVSVISFFLSAVIDNLTTTIVMVSLVRKIVADAGERLLFVGLIVIAANAGGAWSPIGDVTTTMLWIGGQITTGSIVVHTFLASLVCALVPTLLLARPLQGEVPSLASAPRNLDFTASPRERNGVFFLGIACLLLIPVFKTVTHLPPYVGMLLALAILWVVTEFIHGEKDEAEKGALSVSHALKRIDAPSILFFLGILLAVAALESVGVLSRVSGWLDRAVENVDVILLAMGLLSAVIDNVPLVAGLQGAYGLDRFPVDHSFWMFLAYCAGTGGSILIIGSAAGVAAMGLEKIEFFQYLRRVGWVAALGYLLGAATYIVQRALLGSS
jgi:Na+/H+ antiporter NhaD/arsenite permease-like protein